MGVKMKRVLAVIFLVCILSIGGFVIFREQAGFDITIKNQTDKNISDLKITYQNITADIEIPPLSPKEEYKLRITPTEDFGENSMKLFYKDDKGRMHTETVIGYFEQGYSGNAKITLNSINKNGVIEMKIVEDLNL
jgi:hypothetical protein